MTIRFQCIGLICVAAGSLCAQQGRISGPTSGLVFDANSHGLRPVIGIPGAGTIGAPLGFAKDLSAAWVSPRLDLVIGRATDGSLRIYRIGTDSATEIDLSGIDKGPLLSVVFSPSGSAALLQSAKVTHVVTGLPDAPKVAGTIERNATPRSRPSAGGGRLQRLSLAISDDGAYVLSSIAGAVRVQTTSGENRRLADVAINAVVAFAPESHDAAVADAIAGVVLFRDLAGAATPRAIAVPPDSRTSSFSDLAFSADGRRLHLASAANHSVTTFDVKTGNQTTASCECSPRSLVRMGKVFRLTEFSADPLWLLDGDHAEPRIVFVPAVTPAN